MPLAPGWADIALRLAFDIGGKSQFRYEIRWRAPRDDRGPAAALDRVAAAPTVIALNWRLG